MSGTVILANALSINMLAWAGGDDGPGATLHCRPITEHDLKFLLDLHGFTSAIGHTDVANIVGERLGIDVPVFRWAVSLGTSDILVVAQYIGPRLNPGTIELPDGAEIRFWEVICDEYGEFTGQQRSSRGGSHEMV